MKTYIVSAIIVLSLINLNSPQPILEPHRVAHSDNVVVSFVKGEAKQEFPDRTDAHQHAVNLETAREASRLQAIEAQRQADIANQPKVVSNTPQSSSNDPKMFIYLKESGNNPLARNAGGCLGLGQACPGSKLLAVCPNLDYACEDAFFTNYAISRYGSWEGAYQFWLAHSWW